MRDILRVGAASSIVSLSTNVSIATATGLAGLVGPAAVAGYGTGARLEYLLVPLVFGLGAPVAAMVGTSHRRRPPRSRVASRLDRRGDRRRPSPKRSGSRRRSFPPAWLSLFGSDPKMIEVGTSYLQIVGPFYGFFGGGLALYFASQGAGRVGWADDGRRAARRHRGGRRLDRRDQIRRQQRPVRRAGRGALLSMASPMSQRSPAARGSQRRRRGRRYRRRNRRNWRGGSARNLRSGGPGGENLRQHDNFMLRCVMGNAALRLPGWIVGDDDYGDCKAAENPGGTMRRLGETDPRRRGSPALSASGADVPGTGRDRRSGDQPDASGRQPKRHEAGRLRPPSCPTAAATRCRRPRGSP